MKISHCFVLKDGTKVDSLPPEQEEALKQRMREGLAEIIWRGQLKANQQKRGENAS